METNPRVTARSDVLDKERFEQMLESAPWKAYRARVEAELRRAVEQCVSEENEIALRRAQGNAAGVRVVMGLPAVMLAEMKKALKGA